MTILPTAANRDETFTITDSIKVYGGFAGGETELAQRDWFNNRVILSGNVGNLEDETDNSYNVVTFDGDSFFTVFDGFTVSDGYANERFSGENGAGISAEGASGAELGNLIIASNFAIGDGAGLYQSGSELNLTNTAFLNNIATNGGAISSVGDTTNITNGLFVNNRGTEGGAISVQRDTTLNLVNSTVVDNQANLGGAIYVPRFSSEVELNIENSIIGENVTGEGGTIFEGEEDTIAVNNSLVVGGYEGGNNIIDVNPLFAAPANNDFSLQAGSPALNAGNNEATENIAETSDLLGNPRVVEETVDLGAYENVLTAEAMDNNSNFVVDSSKRIIYVNQNATGNGDGTSWENAYTDLQLALGDAQAEDEVWVAQGTYYPTDGSDRDETFTITDSIKVYGGFAGGETELAQRDWFNNRVILSGNIGNLEDETDNSYNVVTFDGDSFFTVFDGFTVSDGYANERFSGENGAGISAEGASGAELGNLIIASNFAIGDGAGLYQSGSELNLTNTAFLNNIATNGGAISSVGDTTNITNGLFVNNRGTEGGAISVQRDTTLNLVNSTVVDNQANLGGAIYVPRFSSEVELNIENSIIGENVTGEGGTIFEGEEDTIAVNNSLVVGGYEGNGNNIIDADPLFVDPESSNFGLQEGSPAIDVGNNEAIAGLAEIDLVGNPRINNSTVDLGAFEGGAILSEDDLNNGENPVPPEAPSDIPEPSTIYRFFNTQVGVHFYTASEVERDSISENLPQFNLEGASFTSAPPSDDLTGVAPVYRFLNTDTGVHLYTISENERNSIQANLPNYQFEGVAYYGYTEEQENTTPLYRFYNPVINAHFYTPSATERNGVLENLPDYQPEGNNGIAFYIQPLDTELPPNLPVSPTSPMDEPPAEPSSSSAFASIVELLDNALEEI